MQCQEVNLGEHVMQGIGLSRVAQCELGDNVTVQDPQSHGLSKNRDLRAVSSGPSAEETKIKATVQTIAAKSAAPL